jgi:hypothetical protein
MLAGSITDAKGQYSCDVLVEGTVTLAKLKQRSTYYDAVVFVAAFEFWVQNQVSLEDLYQSFKMLQYHKKIVTTPDANLFRDGKKVTTSHFSRKLYKDLDTAVPALRNILNEVLCVDGGNLLNEEDVRNVIREISSNSKQDITFEDFLRLFRS